MATKGCRHCGNIWELGVAKDAMFDNCPNCRVLTVYERRKQKTKKQEKPAWQSIGPLAVETVEIEIGMCDLGTLYTSYQRLVKTPETRVFFKPLPKE